MTLNPDFISELKKYFSGYIRMDKISRILYSTDASIYQIEPLGVVIPKTKEDLRYAVELAAKYKIPILPRGSGSSLAGQAIGQALILDCSRFLDKIVEINPEERFAKVEPGVILANLNRAAAKSGLMFGPDPASAERATIGGVIGNNATGAHSILYGMTADHLLASDVILADGSLATWGPTSGDYSGAGDLQRKITAAAYEIRVKYAETIKSNWPKTWRNSVGYRLNYLLPWSATRPPQWDEENYPRLDEHATFNLASLLAGSEGNLAVISSATLNLVPKPKHTILGVLSYRSIADACDAVPTILESKPSAVELVPQMLIRLARSIPAYAGHFNFVQGDPEALLIVEYSGSEITSLRDLAKSLGPDVMIAELASDQAKVWAVRKVGLGIFDSRHSSERPVAFIEDCAIPVEQLGNYVREVERILLDHGTTAAFYAHASAGCLHIRPILDLKTERGVKNLRSISYEVLKLTLRLGGSMSSEHGDGLVRGEWLKDIYGDQILEAMKTLKKAADPDAILNPKKMYDAAPMDTNLRYGGKYQNRPWQPTMDFSRQRGITGAIEQCNGQGVCRKFDGVMCPSFQATREEMYSTRGRANLLRALISYRGLSVKSEEVKQTLDLCLACKGCKAECPSGVDMAKLKYEFLSQYYKDHPRPIRDYVFGNIGVFANLAYPFRMIVNKATDSAIFRKVCNRYFGISAERSLPKFGEISSAKDGYAGSSAMSSGASLAESCIFLRDTFTHYFEPEVEKAALTVLFGCGINVKVLPMYGAGRTLISKGFLIQAREHLERLVYEIDKLDPSGTLPIVGIEPSEIYTLRDEIFDLLPNLKDKLEKLALRAWLIDEYLIRPSTKDSTRRIERLKLPNPMAEKSGIALHGHCYQKSQSPHPDGLPIGVLATAELLRAVNFDVKILNTGCCGMAGAFGYEAENYDLSIKVGELTLFPELRKENNLNDGIVVADGTSCRSQILDGVGVRTHHAIEIVADCMGFGAT